MDSDGHVLTVGQMEADGVGGHLSTGRNRHRGLTAEGQADARRLVDVTAAACGLGIGQFHGLDFRSPCAELIGEFQPHVFAAYRHLHNLAQRVVAQPWRRRVVVRFYQLRGRPPRTYPVVVGHCLSCHHHAGGQQQALQQFPCYHAIFNYKGFQVSHSPLLPLPSHLSFNDA